MADIMSPEKRSRVMSRIRGKDTTPERYLRQLLLAAGLRFTQHDSNLPGRPDFVFPERRVVVFVHGDFWHGWRFPQWQHKLSQFWREKIAANRSRGERHCRWLRRHGWRVVTVWEHQVESDAVACARRVLERLGLKWTKARETAVERALESLPPLRRRRRLPKP